MNTSTTTTNPTTTFIVSRMVNVQKSKTSNLAGYNHIGGFPTTTEHHYIETTTRMLRQNTSSQKDMLEAIRNGQFTVRVDGKFICSDESIKGMKLYQVANLHDQLQGLPLVISEAVVSKASFYTI